MVRESVSASPIDTEESIKVEYLFERLIQLCKEVIDELFSEATYGLPRLIEDTARFVVSTSTTLSLEGKAKIKTEGIMLKEYLIKLRDYYLYAIILILQSMSKLIKEMDKKDVEKITSHVASCFEEITRSIINGWLVKRIREVRKVKEEIFDNYSVFKDKWNSLLNELEKVTSEHSVEIKRLEPAKELGVTIGN